MKTESTFKRQPGVIDPNDAGACLRFAVRLFFESSDYHRLGPRWAESEIAQIPIIAGQAHGGYFKEMLMRSLATSELQVARDMLVKDALQDLGHGRISPQKFVSSMALLDDLLLLLQSGDARNYFVHGDRLRLVA